MSLFTLNNSSYTINTHFFFSDFSFFSFLIQPVIPSLWNRDAPLCLRPRRRPKPLTPSPPLPQRRSPLMASKRRAKGSYMQTRFDLPLQRSCLATSAFASSVAASTHPSRSLLHSAAFSGHIRQESRRISARIEINPQFGTLIIKSPNWMNLILAS